MLPYSDQGLCLFYMLLLFLNGTFNIALTMVWLLLLFPQTKSGAYNSIQTIVIRPDHLHVVGSRRKQDKEKKLG